MSARAVLTTHQLADLKRESDLREQTIISLMLQVPDYPPLPACPACGERPTEVCQTEGTGDPEPMGALLLDFGPCGHSFRVDPWS